MEIIAVILFLLFFVVGIGDKNKRKNNAAARPGANAKAQPQASAASARGARKERPARQAREATTIPRSMDDLKAAMGQWLEDGMVEPKGNVQPPIRPAAQSVQGASMLDDAECAGGSMPHAHAEGRGALADEDCVGGSMEHTHTEGVSRRRHARRMAAIDAEHAGAEDILPEAIDARALRRAVVMAEVLGKPRALRRV